MTTPIACVIGWPIGHSRSPLIHRHWLRTMGIEGDYAPFALPPDDAAAFFDDFARSGFVGGNVTVPHKEIAFSKATVVDSATEALGAVNTVWLEDGRLMGTSTDAVGFLANLDHATPDWSNNRGPAVVLGAGGAARAVIWALLERSFDTVIVINRTIERAEALARRFGDRVRAADWESSPSVLREASVLINATSLGMTGQPSLPLDVGRLPDDAIVNDLVYAPLETDLLQQARERGLRTVDGLGMLLHQAVPGFEKWFGVRPIVTEELRELVVADLTGQP